MRNIIGMIKVGGTILLFTCTLPILMGIMSGCAVRVQHAMNIEMGEELPATSTRLGVEQEVTYIPADAEVVATPEPTSTPEIPELFK